MCDGISESAHDLGGDMETRYTYVVLYLRIPVVYEVAGSPRVPASGQFREFESPRVHARINS